MFEPIALGHATPAHQLKFCNGCDCEKPPEGGVAINDKWLCQPCWNRKITGRNLKQNRSNGFNGFKGVNGVNGVKK